MEKHQCTMIFLFHQKSIDGEEVEMKVSPGDNITLYCDRSVTLGSSIVWIRNCSHENQPSLIIDFRKLDVEIFQRFSFIHNPYNNSHDLHITNISVSDLGLYYCAKLEMKVGKDGKGFITSSEVYSYGNRTTRLSLKVTEMEGTRVTVITLVCVLFCEQQRVFGSEVDMRVKAGDSITLYCDCVVPLGSHIVWWRNCSHEHQPYLLIDPLKIFKETFSRFSFVLNSSGNSYDLHITNASVSDEGIYYCAKRENKINTDAGGIINAKSDYEYGNKTTRLSVLEAVSMHESTTIATSPVSDCVLCWTLLFSVCPVCVLLSSLLSSICVLCFCRAQTTGSELSAEVLNANVFKANSMEKHQCEMKTGKICLHSEVSYRLLTSAHPCAKI
ncbi:hypothetical protein G5714_000988 [Onychostoma macrolepis]|uniref:Ig-like domain-containing protein n=1 Tax=Onychostoma macrolepis TaxID=369639 RepID=A0A7J6DI10_9TELE|nr:hypothetical protein G5714_000988 [Onychostoma macrolepis]